MTRAIVRLIGDKEGIIKLYRSSDGGICNGIGGELFEFCKTYNGVFSVGEVLKTIVFMNEKFGLALLGEKRAVDYVYDIVVENGMSMTLICRQVDWRHNKSSSIEERLGDPIDIEAELIKYKKNAWKGVYKCPYCGETPSSVYSGREGRTVRCDNYLCKGHSLIGWCENMRNAEDEWNKACENVTSLG